MDPGRGIRRPRVVRIVLRLWSLRIVQPSSASRRSAPPRRADAPASDTPYSCPASPERRSQLQPRPVAGRHCCVRPIRPNRRCDKPSLRGGPTQPPLRRRSTTPRRRGRSTPRRPHPLLLALAGRAGHRFARSRRSPCGERTPPAPALRLDGARRRRPKRRPGASA